ncbi:MAG: M42 family metallopeptidase [Lachnospirales bacterium]
MLLEKLVNANGVVTYEDEVRKIIIEEIKDHVDSVKVDSMGNIIAVKNSEAKGKHIGLSAHMDEVGLIIHDVDSEGLLKFKAWGINDNVLLSKPVVIGEKKLKGVIGGKPIHLQKPEERLTNIPLESLYIDIGATSKEDALKHVQIGDVVAFDSEYKEFGENKAKSKAFDDRVGCYAIIKALQSDTKHKITACFVVQEEGGLRGSIITANRINVDFLLNLEGTISADTIAEKEKDYITTLGSGVVLSLMDRSTLYHKKYRDEVIKVAEKYDIPYQFRKSNMGGTDTGNYQMAHGGTPVMNICVGCRYIHSPVSVADITDVENMVLLVEKFIEEYNLEV